jgi:hypothetical protein
MVGVVVVGMGSPIYARMAINLALTVKAYQGLPVTVLVTPEHHNHLNTKTYPSGASEIKALGAESLFHKIIEVPIADITPARIKYPSYQMGKLLAHKYSPYDITLQIDADSVALDRPRAFERWALETLGMGKDAGLGGITFCQADFRAENPASMYNWWTNKHVEVADAVGLELGMVCTQYNSSILTYRKGTTGEKVMAKALELYNTIDPALFQGWAGYLPDECVINIASGLMGSQTQVPNRPEYNYSKMQPHHIAMTLWGNNVIDVNLMLKYNTLAIQAQRKLGIKGKVYTLLQAMQKGSHLVERVVY